MPATSEIEPPLVVFPREPATEHRDCARELQACAVRYLCRLGCISFRGFALHGAEAFAAFARGFGAPVEEPAAALGARPELAHAQAPDGRWPLRLWLHHAPGADPLWLVDGREAFRRVPRRLRARFVHRGLRYVRDLEPGLPAAGWGRDRAWVEAWCRARGVGCEWRGDGGLRMTQCRPAVLAHPVTRELVWCNRAHELGSAAPGGGSACEVLYADGAPIEESAREEVRGVIGELTRALCWEVGDVLLLDNLLLSHARGGARELGPARALCSAPWIEAEGAHDPCALRMAFV